MEEIEKNYQRILEGIPKGVCLIAVSKGQPTDALMSLYRLGHRDFGENYAQELVKKNEILRRNKMTDVRWHFIGKLQTNKVKGILPIIHAIHSIDSEKLALQISKTALGLGMKNPIPIFIEVNIETEKTKAGFAPEEVRATAENFSKIPEIKTLGLMCIPQHESKTASDPFIKLKKLSDRCGSLTEGKLSMGMSADYKRAIQAGSTHVRVGTAIFGSVP